MITARLLGAALLGVVAVAPGTARATDLAVVAPGATRSILKELVPAFEKASGDHVAVTFGTAGEVERRLTSREPFDVALITKTRLDTLEADGTIVKGSVVVIGRSPVALAVKQGAPKPDISTVEAFKQALLTARSVAYTDPASGGTSGIHMQAVLRRLGIADQLAAKTKLITGAAGAPPAVGEAVAHGEAELGLQPISELIGTAGIEIVGAIPPELQSADLTYGAGLPTDGRQPKAGAAFIRFLVEPAAVAVVKAKGMLPGNGP